MGSTTYHSIGRPLPNRRNMVLTRHIIENDGVEEFASITECFEHLWIDENVFVIGGAQVYSQFLESNLLDEIWVSHISGTHECDVFFPDYTSQYEAYETEHFSTFDFIKFRRIKL
jgi:dihydrofolate reductase